jgi:general secretion pathway protein K
MLKKRRGSILILALWTLTMLSVFAATIGLTIRQRINLMGRVEKRSELRQMADAGVKTAVSALKLNMYQNGNGFNNMTKYYRHNNEAMFKEQPWASGSFSVQYPYYDAVAGQIATRYGLLDEESKININTAGRDVLVQLFISVFTSDRQKAQDLADSILNWREFGRSNTTGFYGDDYYLSLDDPYEPKSGNFELIDELKLVHGITDEVFDAIYPYVTIYGDGMVNINTASRPVLMALGLDGALADKVISARSGKDRIDATEDDLIFDRPYDVATEVLNAIKIDNHEIAQIDQLNQPPKIKTSSEYYLINSVAKLNSGLAMSVQCVFNSTDNRIEYWREKN